MLTLAFPMNRDSGRLCPTYSIISRGDQLNTHYLNTLIKNRSAYIYQRWKCIKQSSVWGGEWKALINIGECFAFTGLVLGLRENIFFSQKNKKTNSQFFPNSKVSISNAFAPPSFSFAICKNILDFFSSMFSANFYSNCNKIPIVVTQQPIFPIKNPDNRNSRIRMWV